MVTVTRQGDWFAARRRAVELGLMLMLVLVLVLVLVLALAAGALPADVVVVGCDWCVRTLRTNRWVSASGLLFLGCRYVCLDWENRVAVARNHGFKG